MPKEVKSYCMMNGDEVLQVICSSDSKAELSRKLLKLFAFTDLIEVPYEAEVCAGDDIKEFVERDFSRGKRPLKDRYDEGLLKGLDPELKVDDENKVVLKSFAELVRDGIEQLEKWDKVDEKTGEKTVKTWPEAVADGSATYEEFLAQVREERDHIINKTDLVHLNNERWEKMSPQERGDWSRYKQELRDFPSTNPPVTEIKDIQWPIPPAK